MLGVHSQQVQVPPPPPPPMMDCLPPEIMSQVLACIATSSPADLFHCKISCKSLHELTEEKHVLQQVSLERLMPRRSWVTDDQRTFFLRCLESNNPHALFRFGMEQYFSKMVLEEGFENLKRAAEQGKVEAGYVVSLILICSGDKDCVNKGTQMLINIMRAIRGKGIVACRKNLRELMSTMWLDNKLIMAETKPDISCATPNQHEQEVHGRWGNYVYDDEDFEDGLVCKSCKIVREIKFFFYQLLSIV